MLLRVLRTARATLSRVFYLDEVESSATGPVSVSMSRLDGTVVESGNAVPDGGGYSWTFSGSDDLDELQLTWTVTVGGDALVLDQDRVEVVGGFYFGLAEGRDVDPVLRDPAKFPTADLIDRRIQVEAECERITGQAWVPRFCRETLSGAGRSGLVLSHSHVRRVRSVSVAGVPYAAPVVAALPGSATGVIDYAAGWPVGYRNITVEYEHGHDRPNPDIARAAKLRFKSLLLEGRSALPDSAERRVTVDDRGSSTVYRAASADSTGLPAVDAVYGRYGDPRPGFG